LQPRSPLYLIQLNTANAPPDHGGMATYSHELACHLSRRGQTVVLLTYPDRRNAPLDAPYQIRRTRAFDLTELIREGGSARALLSSLPRKVPAMAVEIVRALLPLEATRRRAILWAVNWWPEALAAWIISRALGIPYVITAHGREAAVVPGSRRHLLYRKAFNGAARVFAVSEHTAGLVARCGVDPERIRVIPNGVEPRRFQDHGARTRESSPGSVSDSHASPVHTPAGRGIALEAGASERPGPPLPAREMMSDTLRSGASGAGARLRLLTLARLTPRKGHGQVLEALHLLEDRIPHLVYVIAGGGPLREELARRVQELGLQDKVRFTGEVSEEEKIALLRECDVFVMPNRDIPLPRGGVDTEGFGIVFLEAACCGKPVIGGRAGGVPEAVVPGETGLLVDPEKPREIAEAIHRLWSDPRFAGRLGRAGKDRVEREFDWGKIATRYEKEFTGTRNRS
jgi:phosphatidyl-myo-inositol dimannoside synthase